MENLINVQDEIGETLQAIKDKYSYLDSSLNNTIISRGFIAPKFIKPDSILFLGINPSLPKDYNNVEIDFYTDSEHPYFKKFEEISDKIGISWTHLDILFFRETNQKSVDLYINEGDNGVHFIWDQLILSKKLIELSNAKVIVASNTKVRHFLGYDQNQEKNQGVWMGYKFEFDEKIGTHKIISDGKLNQTPIFFTSMLSGQRALDNGSFKRLVWHIDKVVNG